jgi:peptide/nickel transport system substrate-binding protein
MSRKVAAALGVASALFVAAPALAQKSADTLRIAITDMFSLSDPYNLPLDENAAFYREIYESLIDFDEHAGKWVPNLAKSFKRIDDLTTEFELRDDIKFHNGDKFTANDVKATWDWAGDEKTRIRFKERYNWVKEVEILGPYKIRVHNKFKNAGDWANISYNLKVLNGKLLQDNAAEYGRINPVGTGPYKVNYVDKNKGILTERFADYHDKNSKYHRAPTARVHGLPIPDAQTQIAQLLTGGVDLLRFVSKENAAQLAQQPNLAVTVTQSASLNYITLDAAGRSSNKIMTDERVRKAFIMAIPRDQIVKEIVAGGDQAEIPRSICFKATVGCAPSTDPYKYDPAQAKKLLAEAGYPNGFDLHMYAHAPHKDKAEAIAGELRKVGIRTSVEALPLTLYVKKRGDGEFTAFLGLYPTSANPDVDNLIDFFFGQDRDYWKDDVIADIKKKAEGELDLDKRTALYTPALNRINEKAYIYPLFEQPMVWAHSKDVKLLQQPLSAADPRLGDYAWSDYKGK